MDHFIITAKWLNQYTKNGRGLNKNQAKTLGIAKTKNWFNGVVGKKISLSAKDRFEAQLTTKAEQRREAKIKSICRKRNTGNLKSILIAKKALSLNDLEILYKQVGRDIERLKKAEETANEQLDNELLTSLKKEG